MDCGYRRVIFLDIDGVLLPFPLEEPLKEGALFPPSTLSPLKRLWEHVQANFESNSKNNSRGINPGVEWVLSSTWRVQRSYILDIEEALKAFGIPIQFSDITDPALHSERQWEILDWIRKQKITSMVWLALDDEDLVGGETNAKHKHLFEGRAVRTNSATGLSHADVDAAIQSWDQQLALQRTRHPT